MSRHAETWEIAALRAGLLGGEDSRELLQHIATCSDCQSSARNVVDIDGDSRALVQSITRDEVAANDDARLHVAPAAGVAPTPRRTAIRHRALLLWLAAAAVAAAALVTLLPAPHAQPPQPVTRAVRRGTPAITNTPAVTPPLTRARPAELEALVREAVISGRLAPPETLLRLHAQSDHFRAAGGENVDFGEMRPFAEVLEEQRPHFRWTARKGATYLVLVGERERIVAQSPSLHENENEWQVDRELARGHSYTWQVEIRRGNETTMLPMPPAPAARFSILSGSEATRLAEIRRELPDDHLLLGIVSARAGLKDAAIEQLRLAAAEGNTDAPRLLASMKRWPDRGR